MTLFQSTDTAVEDCWRLLSMAREIREGSNVESMVSTARTSWQGAVNALVQRIQAGDVPPIALEILAGATGVLLPKDYGCHPIWKAAWELLIGAEPTPATYDEDALHVLCTRHILRGNPAWYAASTRAALIGAGYQLHAQMAEARQTLYVNGEAGVGWQALCAAFDAVGATSHAGLEQLGALADAHPESPSMAWLDEVASWIARDDARAKRRKAQLNALLVEGPLGEGAFTAATVVQFGRSQLKERASWMQDAWLRLGGCKRVAPVDPDDVPIEVGLEKIAGTRAKLRKGNEAERAHAKQLDELDEMLRGWEAHRRATEAVYGPFYSLSRVPTEIREPLDNVTHYMLLGYRQTYGLELMRDGIPELERWLAASTPMA
jgi:hypothetical protein